MPFEDRLDELTPEQRELFALFLSQERLQMAAADRYRAPGTPVEEALVRIWSDLLGVTPGVDDNYFELGGDSITIIRMVSQARLEGIQLRTEWVFAHPTIAELAAVSLGAASTPPPAPSASPSSAATLAHIFAADPDLRRRLTAMGAKAVEAFPLTSTQQGLLFHALDAATDGAYVVQWRFRLIGPLDVARFTRAWTQLIERHAALRTIFQWLGLDEPMQLVLDRAAGEIVEEQAPPGADWRALADALMDEERRRPFDLRSAPLMRIRFVRLGEEERLCVWTHHHLILDGWSQQIFLQEFFAAYRGEPLAPLAPHTFRDHVAWLRALDDRPAAAFWQRQLAGYRSPSRPLVPASTAGGVHTVSTRVVRQSPALRDALKHAAVTVSVLYQAAWSLALAHLSEQRDVVFGVALSGRSSGAAGIDRAVGLFINTLPLRLAIDPARSLTAWLRQVQEAQAGLVAHECCGLSAIQRWIQWDRRAPLMDSLYVYERFPLDLSQLDASQALVVRDVETTTHEHYPLVFIVQDEDDHATLVLKHHASPGTASDTLARLLDCVAALPERFVADPGLAVRDLITEWSICVSSQTRS